MVVSGPGGFVRCVRVESGCCLAAGLFNEVVQGGGGQGSGAPAEPAFAAQQVVGAVEGPDQAGEAGRDGVVGEEGDADPVGGQGGQGGRGPALEFDGRFESAPVAGAFDGGAGEAVACRGQQERFSVEQGDGDGGPPGPLVRGRDQGDDAGLVDQEAVGAAGRAGPTARSAVPAMRLAVEAGMAPTSPPVAVNSSMSIRMSGWACSNRPMTGARNRSM